MPLTDQARIAKERLQPRILELWRALVPLQTVVSFMNTGAHPDDEMSAMLAAFSLRDGIDISYACSTRGEGGQNDIGTETTEALGVLRTAEMEQACDAIGLRMYWLSQSPEDTIFDFGFSKSGIETMEKWGRERTLRRFVDIIRIEKPDIICPTFLDVPGQHGHHRAMTEAAHLVMSLAADTNYEGSTLEPWQVKKLYLPAFSGAGQAYDDDLPPPAATMTVNADGFDPISGWSYERLGQQSRAFHRTQAMGSWVPVGKELNWPLHLAESHVEGPDKAVFSGLPYDLGALGLPQAQKHMNAARAAFPDYEKVLTEAASALKELGSAQVDQEYAHKVDRKREQLAQVIRIASGAEIHAWLDKDTLRPTDQTSMTIESRQGLATNLETSLCLPAKWSATESGISLENADLSDPYPSVYLPNQPANPCIQLTLEIDGVKSATRQRFEITPLVLPQKTADILPIKEVVNCAAERRQVFLQISNVMPSEANATLKLPGGWNAKQVETGFLLNLPINIQPGVYSVPFLLDDIAVQTVRKIEYAHVAQRAMVDVAELKVLVLEAELPNVKVGYIGGGNDQVDYWLERMGMDVTALNDDDLKSDARLGEFDSIVIGIFAIKFRQGLAEQMQRLHKWTRAGGTLLTLYHRPWDNWDKDQTPPEMLEIGQPSLRWRVTNEAAKVTHLAEHTLLTNPNEISEADWRGWHKERGLYFAKSWSDAYAPLLEMADADEAPHHGALLTAEIGKGRHTHCALILHHQMEKLVPGAFRLMANLLAKRG